MLLFYLTIHSTLLAKSYHQSKIIIYLHVKTDILQLKDN